MTGRHHNRRRAATAFAAAALILGLVAGGSAAMAQDALAARTLTEACFPELINQIEREPDLLMTSSAAYSLDYNQNIEADLSVRDVLYKRADNGIYHLDIGGGDASGFECILTLPPGVSRDTADRTVAGLLDGEPGWRRFPRMGEGFERLSWSRTDRARGIQVQRSVRVEALPDGGPARISVVALPLPAQ